MEYDNVQNWFAIINETRFYNINVAECPRDKGTIKVENKINNRSSCVIHGTLSAVFSYFVDDKGETKSFLVLLVISYCFVLTKG